MDQTKIGALLRELRKERNLSQEQLAEQFNVSTRSISRWENGNTMPDISIMIDLADYYEIDLRELLNGERKSENMTENMRETLDMIADYSAEEKAKLVKELRGMLIASAFFFASLGIIVAFQLQRVNDFFSTFANFATTLGLVYSIMSIIKLGQVTGRLDKKAHKKAVIGMVIAGVIVMIFCILLILFAMGAFDGVFGAVTIE